MYEITVMREFAAAHAIRLPDGSLEPVHGHNWPVRVTVAAKRLDGIETVMDFHELAHRVDDIVKPFQNSMLNDVEPFAGPAGTLAVNPTAERVAWWIGRQVGEGLPAGVRVVRVEVGEAPGCWAAFCPGAGDRGDGG
ncbi:MAG: 6-pyruvoyl tetrahydropterin synthase family protein [Phycisphaeraceae bacterium]|nr:6-pyruvoyl tetrahydropterin synthase family protein [Phycisphaeraceae bacterium]